MLKRQRTRCYRRAEVFLLELPYVSRADGFDIGRQLASGRIRGGVPFTKPHCRYGFQSSCVQGEFMLGAQATYARVPLANGTLVVTGEVPSNDLITDVLATSDVLGTGWYAADAANMREGSTEVVVGDGAVGLMGVLAAKELGAERIIAMSRHKSRQDLAIGFGATDVVAERGEEGVARIKELTRGVGANAVLDCVGTQSP